jgi:site-specific DNA-adenine methylase
MNKSFLKWAGNKFRVLPDLLPHIGSPKKYIEPFGGGLFEWHLSQHEC